MKEPISLIPSIENQEFHYFEDILSSGLIKLSGQTGEIIYANDIFFQLNQTTKEEYIEKYQNCLFKQMNSDTVEKIRKKIKEVIAEQTPLSFYYEIETTKKETKSLHLQGKLIPYENSKKAHIFLCLIEDVTREKIYKEANLVKQLHTKILTKLIGSIFWEYDIPSQTLYRYGTISNTYSNEKIIPRYIETMLSNHYIHKDDEEAFRCFFESLTNGKKYKSLVIRYKDNLNIYNWYQLHGVVLFDNCNVPIRVFGTTVNIEKQERQENKISTLSKKSMFAKSINEYLKRYGNDLIQHALILIEINNYDSLKRIHGKTLLENIMEEAMSELKNIFPKQLLGQLSKSTLGVFYYELFNGEDLIEQLQNYKTIVNQLYNNSSAFSITCSMGIALEKGHSTYNILYRKAEVALSTAQKKEDSFFDFYGHSNTSQIIQKKFSPLEEVISVSPELSFLRQTLTLLESNNVENVLYHYLFQICQYYKADHAYIMLKNHVTHTLSVAYQYSMPDCLSDINSLYQYPFELIGDYIKLFDTNNCYICSNINEIEPISSVMADSYRLAGVNSFLQYALYENDYCIGFLGIDICSDKFKIENSQISSFYFIGRFLSHVLKNLQRKHCMALPYNRDKLTKLLSFQEFLQYGEEIISKNPMTKFAVISCNIRNFERYNKNYGITIGNKILKKYAHTLLLSLTENELCGRILADQFVLLLTYNNTTESLLSKLVIHSNNDLCNTRQLPDYYRFNIVYGICPLSKNLSLFDAFQKAIYVGNSLKDYTGNQYAIYGPEFEQEEKKRNLFKKSLQDSLNKHQFLPYYQPKFSIKTKELTGFEALARWKYQSDELRYPQKFLSIMEESYDTIELDFWMIHCVCKDLHMALKDSEKIYPVSINLSAAHLITTNFIERLLHIVRYYQIPLSYLKFEITEDFFNHYRAETNYFISELKELGCSITIDDFGSHYSSLNVLRDFDIDTINLDISFFQNHVNFGKEQTISKTIVQLANELNITVNVKRLEKINQLNALSALGCDTVQGFLFSEALPFEQIKEKYLILNSFQFHN